MEELLGDDDDDDDDKERPVERDFNGARIITLSVLWFCIDSRNFPNTLVKQQFFFFFGTLGLWLRNTGAR